MTLFRTSEENKVLN